MINLPQKPKTLSNVEPTVICWEWNTPDEWEWGKTPGDGPASDPIDNRVALLVVIDSTEDPIPEENKKIFDVEKLVRIEKHIGARGTKSRLISFTHLMNLLDRIRLFPFLPTTGQNTPEHTVTIYIVNFMDCLKDTRKIIMSIKEKHVYLEKLELFLSLDDKIAD